MLGKRVGLGAVATGGESQRAKNGSGTKGKRRPPGSLEPTLWRKDGDKYMAGRPAAAQLILPAGTYSIARTLEGVVFTATAPLSDRVVELPGCQSADIVASIEHFWTRRLRYEQFGILFKRGILVHGPPGTGKTILVRRVCDAIASRGGVGIFGSDPMTTAMALKDLRALQPDTPALLIYEGLESWCDEEDGYGEAMTSLLDGEHQVDNVVCLATTNYIEKLPPRIVNRPARFDEVICIGAPSAEARHTYLLNFTDGYGEAVDPRTLETWVERTDGLMVAHLREFVAAVLCLGHNPDAVIERLKKMGC